METDRIAVRSRKQAMDWGLVLASQGIEAIINRSEAGWELIVEAREYQRAQEALEQYRIENRGWKWKYPVAGSELVFHWGSLGWVVVIAAADYWSTVVWPSAREAGILDTRHPVTREWWRLFTAMSLHQNLGHLMSNATTGFALLGLAMARFGAGVALLAAFLAGAAGNAADLLIYSEPHRSLGASGMVTAALGLVTSQSFAFWRKFRTGARFLMRAAAGGVLILVLIGFEPDADIAAHIGGFIAGAAIGYGLGHLKPATLQRGPANALSMAAVVTLFLTTWLLALGAR
jgi:membrane associated rhomboid family serine protease